MCVVNTESCTIFAIEAATGKQLWSMWLGDPLTSAPTIADGLVFAAYPAQAAENGTAPPGVNHALAAFDLKTGKIAWQLWLDGDVMSAPVAVGEFLYVSTFAGTVIKLEQKTGKVRYAMKASATSAPVVQFDHGVEQMYAHAPRRGREGLTPQGDDRSAPITTSRRPSTRLASKKAGVHRRQGSRRRGAHAAKSKDKHAANGFWRRCARVGGARSRPGAGRRGQRVVDARASRGRACCASATRTSTRWATRSMATDRGHRQHSCGRSKAQGRHSKSGGRFPRHRAARGRQVNVLVGTLERQGPQASIRKSGKTPNGGSSGRRGRAQHSRWSTAAGSMSVPRTASSPRSTPATRRSPAGRRGAATRSAQETVYTNETYGR